MFTTTSQSQHGWCQTGNAQVIYRIQKKQALRDLQCSLKVLSPEVKAVLFLPREALIFPRLVSNFVTSLLSVGIQTPLYLTYSSDSKEKASVAEIILRGLVLFGSLEVGQLFAHGTPVGQCIAGKILG